MSKQFVIFDMDGVIFDSERVWTDSWLKANKIFDVPDDEMVRESCCGKKENTIREELRNLYPNVDIDSYRDFIRNEVLYISQTQGFSIKPGFFEIIEFLQSKNIELALATGSQRPAMVEFFKKTNIEYDKIFKVVVTSNEVTLAKPSPEIYQLTCQKLGAKPADCFVIEDSPNGIIAASKAGCKPIMVIDLIEPDEEIASLCKCVCNNLIEAKEYLEKVL